MDRDPPVVAPGTDQEVAAWRAVEHSETILAVVDASGRFVGLVPPRRLLRDLLAEHDEDLARRPRPRPAAGVRVRRRLHVAADVRRDERWWYQTDLDKLEKRLGTVTRH